MLNDDIIFLKKITNIDTAITYDYLVEGENYIETYYNNKDYQQMPTVLKRTNYEFILLQVKQDLSNFTKLEQKRLLINFIILNIYYLCYKLKTIIITNGKNEEFENTLSLLKNLYKTSYNCTKILRNELTEKENKISNIYLYFFSLTEIINNLNLYAKQQLQTNELNYKGFNVYFDSNIDIKENSENLDKIKTLIMKLNNKSN